MTTKGNNDIYYRESGIKASPVEKLEAKWKVFKLVSRIMCRETK